MSQKWMTKTGAFHSVPTWMHDVHRLLRSPRWELSIWADYVATRRRASIFRHSEGNAHSDRVVLVPLLTPRVYEIKQQMMLASALRLSGWRVVVLVRSKAAGHQMRYSRAFGLQEILFFDELELTPEEEKEAATFAESLSTEPLTFQGVKEWTYRGAWIGPQILASVSRKTFEGAPDPADPATRAEIFALLPNVLHTVAKADLMMTRVKPELTLVNEANYSSFGPLVDMAIQRAGTVIQFVQPWRDDALIFKRLTPTTRRQHPASVERDVLHRLAENPWTPQLERRLESELTDRYGGKWFLQSRNQPGVSSAGQTEVLESLGLDPSKKLAVIFSHVLWDANLFYGDDLFQNYGEWFVQTIRAAVANPAVEWLIKLHPANIWKRAYEKVSGEFSELRLIRERIGRLPDHVKLLFPDTEISSLTLYEVADYGVTVRGTPGMEMACYGKAVLTGGTGRYSGLGFTVDSPTPESYLQKLLAIQDLDPPSPEAIALAKWHAYCIFRLRQWEMRSFTARFDPQRQGSHPLDHNLVQSVGSLDDVHKNRDLDTFAAWAADASSMDFLAPDANP